MENEKNRDNTFLKNKLPFIILIFLILIGINVNVFATDTISFVDRNGEERVLPDLPEDFKNQVDISNGFAVKYYGGRLEYIVFLDNSESFFYISSSSLYLSGTCSSIDISTDGTSYSNAKYNYTPSIRLGIYSEFIYFSCPVYSDSSKSSIYYEGSSNFFPQTPQVIIAEITQVEELPKMIAKTMKVIIPAGLVIFGILLVILLVKSVILRVT